MACHKIKRNKCFNKGQVCLRIGRQQCKIPLIHLRVFLFLTNLVILAAALASFSAGRDARSKVQTQFAQVKILKEHTRGQVEIVNEEWVSALVKHIEKILYITSFSLLLYWLIYGVAISLYFGGSYATCVLMLSVPHTVVMVLWELGLVAFFVKMGRVDGQSMDGFYAEWSHNLVIIFTPTCLVQLITAILPFFITSSSNKEDGQVSIDERGIWHNNMKMPTPHTPRPHPMRHASNSEYVDFNPQVWSLYHTEMPEQILNNARPGAITRIRKTSLSTGQAVINTMSKVYNANNTQNSCCRIGQQNNSYQLQADVALPGIYKKYNDDDYMEMSTESPPPSYHSQDQFLV